MQILKKDFCELSKISIDDISNEKLNEIFTVYWSDEIYVLNDKKMVGLITRGDYLRALGKQKISVNENYKFLMESSDTLDKAQEIFYKFKNINSVPVLNDKNELLYTYSVKNKGYINDNEFKWITDDYTGRFMQILDIHNFNIPLSEYFRLNNFNNIFIFGNDYLCNTISIELSNIEDINIVGILTMTDLKNGITNNQELLTNIYKANLLFMADFRYLDEYKVIFDKINIMKLSLYDVLMSYNILYDTTILFKGVAKLQKKLEKHKRNVKFYSFRFPKHYRVKNPSDNEKNLMLEERNNKASLIKPEQKDVYYGDELFPYIPQLKRGNLVIHSDFRSEYINIINRIRITTDNPENYKNSIYIFGSSVAFGWGSEDKYTIESHLQRLVNQNFPNKYQVVNCGVNSMWNKAVLKYINDTSFKAGDIVIFINIFQDAMVRKYTSNYNMMDNLQPIFDRPHDLGEVFVDTLHMNWKGNQKIAEKIFESAICDTTGKNTLKLNKIESLDNISLNSYKKSNKLLFGDNPELSKYLEDLKTQKVDIEGKIGAVLVNCNPFTLGHLYLIEKSASMVDFLYIFVVEEENPHFSFKDRFELVKRGTKHLNNVKVIPSGKFLASVLTFPEYFNKEANHNILVDPSLDVESFANYMAPTLNITMRFVGEEPFDYITRQYNNALKTILPNYSIEVIELPRKNLGSEPISASTARKLLKAKQFDKLKTLVPITTYEYLLENFN